MAGSIHTTVMRRESSLVTETAGKLLFLSNTPLCDQLVVVCLVQLCNKRCWHADAELTLDAQRRTTVTSKANQILISKVNAPDMEAQRIAQGCP